MNLLHACSFFSLIAAADPQSPPAPALVDVRRIWDRAPHNAFTDLIRFRDRWYCVFREGQGHVSPDGAIRVIRSADGESWESAAIFRSADADLRDPKISMTPAGKLMVSGAGAFPQPSARRHQSMAWLSDDGESWSGAREIADADYWLWRIAWHRGAAYGFGYGTREDNPRIRFYRSDDGVRFTAAIENAFDAGQSNETGLVFLPDDTACCLLRRDGSPGTAQLGIARPPYTAWIWKDLGVRIGGPQLLRLPDGRLVAAVRLLDGGARTSLCWLDPAAAKLTEFLRLPSGGDTSYAGLGWKDGLLWVSYYSSHEGKTAIYLARVNPGPASGGPPAAGAVEGFGADPGWEGSRNRMLGDVDRKTVQSFGYRNTRLAGGKSAGEIGGRVQRSVTPAYYALEIPTRTLEDRLSASGRFSLTGADSGSGALFGWFHSTSRGWRTSNSLAFRIDGNGGRYWVLFEYGTRHWKTGGGATFEGRYQTTSTRPFLADGTSHAWDLSYDPAAAGGRGEIVLTLDGIRYPAVLEEGHREDGAEFDRFGLFNQQLSGDGLEIHFDDVTVGGRLESFDRDPAWVGRGNEASFRERFIRPLNDFGFSPGARAGGEKGEIGGVIWRDIKPAYYGKAVGPLSLKHRLRAEGRLVLDNAASDSAVSIGWFNSADCARAVAAKGKEPRRNVLGILVEGLSRDGHYFRPEYAVASGAGSLRGDGPIVRPDGQPHRWSMDYDPEGAGGRGRIAFTFDGREGHFDLEPGHRDIGAAFDRFGLHSWAPSDGHFVEIYLDDLAFTQE